ncbi:hypothetical protein [Pelosinus sp. UFO1]|uniref:hypothetical protein n=1 Tax=Pelosinus sp. UFO1 TaxID=484770 RepID=UPI0004D13792|nr:hypothetical protein [Pelosinus sp. UFO1]AIF51277.1 hypothetical protein UFO1_1726 [Pelosinus sp. UFO1]
MFNRSKYKTLIDTLITKFDPTKYENEYQKQVIKMIEDKAVNEEIINTTDTAPHYMDLMAALEASIASTKAASKANEKKKTPRKSKKTA